MTTWHQRESALPPPSPQGQQENFWCSNVKLPRRNPSQQQRSLEGCDNQHRSRCLCRSQIVLTNYYYMIAGQTIDVKDFKMEPDSFYGIHCNIKGAKSHIHDIGTLNCYICFLTLRRLSLCRKLVSRDRGQPPFRLIIITNLLTAVMSRVQVWHCLLDSGSLVERSQTIPSGRLLMRKYVCWGVCRWSEYGCGSIL